jgi:hypothetical protein
LTNQEHACGPFLLLSDWLNLDLSACASGIWIFSANQQSERP